MPTFCLMYFCHRRYRNRPSRGTLSPTTDLTCLIFKHFWWGGTMHKNIVGSIQNELTKTQDSLAILHTKFHVDLTTLIFKKFWVGRLILGGEIPGIKDIRSLVMK